jgi:hypothetical protein
MLLQQLQEDEEWQAIRSKTLQLQGQMAILYAQLNPLQQQEQTQQPRKTQAQSKKRRPIIIDEETYEDGEENDEEENDSWYYDSDEEAYVERRPQKRYREIFPAKVQHVSPLSLELKQVDW